MVGSEVGRKDGKTGVDVGKAGVDVETAGVMNAGAIDGENGTGVGPTSKQKVAVWETTNTFRVLLCSMLNRDYPS